MHPFVPSGHAFVCFDSKHAADACARHFKPKPFDLIKHFWKEFVEKCCCCFLDKTNIGINDH